MRDVALILHNIRSAHNVGAIFRTADACGVSKIFLTGYTPTPIDRFGREVPAISKTALGAEKSIAWEHTTIQKAYAAYPVIALEQDARAVDIFSYTPQERFALLVGNEVRGVSKQLRDKAEAIVEIPMRGNKESLNVSVATGIALYTLLNT